ncbi:hypothetical protein BUUB107078_25720 [Burkholderia ubonensis]|nr:hypothetical protein BUB20358_00677 [Burkholderia ubonensis]
MPKIQPGMGNGPAFLARGRQDLLRVRDGFPERRLVLDQMLKEDAILAEPFVLEFDKDECCPMFVDGNRIRYDTFLSI